MEEGINVKANLIIAMQTSNKVSFEHIIKTTDVPLYNLKDSHGCNIFHDIANSVIKEEILLEILNVMVAEFIDRYFDDSDDIIRSMLNNRKDRDGHTPLLDAVLNNKRKIVKKFISLGSDPRIKSLNLQNVIHIAAESGLDNLLIYFAKELGTPIDEKDRNEKSPLALACIKGHFSTASFLIAWNADVNSVDLQGNSVLHLATFSQSYKLVRILVIKGSSKSIVNNEGKSALDIAKDNNLNDIFAVLDKPKCLQRMNIFRFEIDNIKSSPAKFILFCCFYTVRSIIQVYYMLGLLFINNEALKYMSIVLIFFSVFTFLLASCKGPGYVTIEPIPLSNLIQTYRSEYICAFCESKKLSSTRHCFICKRCVLKMDHHCPWLNNCIGKGNYLVFLIFLLSNSTDYLFHIVFNIFELISTLSQPIFEFFHITLFISFSINTILFFIIFPIFCIHLVNNMKIKKNKVLNAPSRLTSSDTSSMLITPSISETDTSVSPIFRNAIKMKSSRSCFKKKSSSLDGLTLVTNKCNRD